MWENVWKYERTFKEYYNALLTGSFFNGYFWKKGDHDIRRAIVDEQLGLILWAFVLEA